MCGDWMWGASTDIDAVFESLLDTARATALTAEQVSRMAIVIFSDMECDQARSSNVSWKTAHEAICFKFDDAGFGLGPPTIVYWNLRASKSTPVQRGDTPGVVLMSGFSAAMLSALLSGKDDDDAEDSQGQQPPPCDRHTVPANENDSQRPALSAASSRFA